MVLACPKCGKPICGNAFVVDSKVYHPQCAPIPHTGVGVPLPSEHIPVLDPRRG